LDDSPLTHLDAPAYRISTETVAPTILYAVHCGGLGANVVADNDSTLRINLIALNDGWAWAETS